MPPDALPLDDGPVLVAIHAPGVTVVAVDLPEQGWTRARLITHHATSQLPVSQGVAAVTYRSPAGALLTVPVDLARARRALRLAEDYAHDDATPDTYPNPRYHGGPRAR